MDLCGENGSILTASLTLLEHTSAIISLFSDKLVISDSNDQRLQKLRYFLEFLLEWREETKDNNSHFFSSKLWFDLRSMCLGFQSIVDIKLKKFPGSFIKPAIVNQDCVENHFCQVRACNGQNNNPTFRQQESTQNSIRYGQTTISHKSNAGRRSSELSACTLPR